MPKLLRVILISLGSLCAASLSAQQVCPGLPYVADTPEDELMQAVNGAEKPADQLAALDKYAQEHADSKFMPCVHEYYTMANLKLNQYDQVIDHGEKGLAGSYADMMLIMNVTKAYLASGKVSDNAFLVIDKAPEQLKAETNPFKPPQVSDAEWQKALQELADQAKDERSYMEYAFLQLLPRLPDGAKRVQILDAFMKAYPDSPNAGQLNLQYFVAYKLANDTAKADEYGEKAIVADPTNIATLNLLADDYATQHTNLDKATEYAKKAADLAPAMKKPDGMSDDQFKVNRDSQLGFAHLTLGYIAFQKAGKTRKVAPAIQEFKTAVDLLNGNPELQGKALYFLGSAYEFVYPPNHKAALDALTRAAGLQSGFQGEARNLLAKVKQAAGQ
jgi:tetratricopeptide (TPR) repeat protein